MKKVIFIFIIFLNLNNLSAIENILYSISLRGLNIREKPSLDAKVLATIPFGESLRFLEDTNTIIDYNNEFLGKWIKISWNDKKGYVLSAFLSTKNPDKTFLEYLSKINIEIWPKESTVVLLFPDFIIEGRGAGCIRILSFYPEKDKLIIRYITFGYLMDGFYEKYPIFELEINKSDIINKKSIDLTPKELNENDLNEIELYNFNNFDRTWRKE